MVFMDPELPWPGCFPLPRWISVGCSSEVGASAPGVGAKGTVSKIHMLHMSCRKFLGSFHTPAKLWDSSPPGLRRGRPGSSERGMWALATAEPLQL